MSYNNDSYKSDSYRRSDSPPRHHQQGGGHHGGGERFQQPQGPPPGRYGEQEGRRFDDDEREQTHRPGPSHGSGGYDGGEGYESVRHHGGGGRFEPPAGPPPGRYGREDEGERYGRQHEEGGYGGEGRRHHGEQGGGYSAGGYNAGYSRPEQDEGYGRQQEERPSHSFGSGGGRQQQQQNYSGGGSAYSSNSNDESPYPSSHQQQQQQQRPSSSSYSASANHSPYPTNDSPYPSTTTTQSSNSNDSPYPPYKGDNSGYTGSSAATGGKPAAYTDMPVHQNAPEGEGEKYSDMSGRRKACFTGINYSSSSHALQGCHNDVSNLSRWVQSQGYAEKDMRFLMDDGRSEEPTRANMIEAMKWLVEGARPNDVLFFHYSGHGSQQRTDQKDEADGMAETICPVDYEAAGMITDDELHQILVSPLPKGCRLTAIFDCCHSGSSLDCPYMYSTSGKLKGPDYTSELKDGALSAIKAYTTRDLGGLFSSLAVTGKKVFDGQQAQEVSRKTRTSEADVISWSGCKDDQTSADASEGGQATGAMSHAFVAALTKAPKQTYNQLLNTIRDELKGKYDQKPQLSCSHELDCDLMAVF